MSKKNIAEIKPSEMSKMTSDEITEFQRARAKKRKEAQSKEEKPSAKEENQKSKPKK